MTIGQRIRNLREKKHISQTDLANKINVTKQNLYKYENGIITNIPSDKIEQIAKIFNVSPAYIMGWGESSTEECNFQDKNSLIINKYSQLNDLGQQKAECYIDDLLDNQKYRRQDSVDLALEKALERQQSSDYYEIAAQGGRGIESGKSKVDDDTFKKILKRHED